MYLFDVSLVVAAHRRDHVHHHRARPWFDAAMAGGEPFAVPIGVWHSFLRLTTSHRVFPVPTPRVEAFAFIEATVSRDHHRAVAPGRRHLELLRRLCDEGDAKGDLVPDAVLAALAVEFGARVVTLDRDFARFPSVEHLRPPGC